MGTSNAELAKLLRSVAAALTLKKGNLFQIRAYETAADSIEHSTAEIRDLWEEKKLGQVPGLGQSLQAHLDELFRTNQVKHFESLLKNYPDILYEMLEIPGVGPKTALELTKLGIKDIPTLRRELKSGELVSRGFSAKIGQKILLGLTEAAQKENRMLLPYASSYAQKIVDYLKKAPGVIEADPLGSLRRQVATIGDLDFSVCAKNPIEVVNYFVKMPGIKRVLDQGTNKASVITSSAMRVDLLVGEPDSYGALLQHFTGGKNHNIHLRTLAEKKSLSLSEYGVKNTKTGKLIPTKKEEDLYKMLGMDTPPPEMREDTGEIEAAMAHNLPRLIESSSIRGDLHLHSNFPFAKPSHGPGVNSLEDIVKRAKQLGYEYVGLSDHPPSPLLGQAGVLKQIEKRTKIIQEIKKRTNGIQILNSLEIDILGDGSLSVPDKALETLDYGIAGIHSGHRGSREEITKRLLKALENPFIDIISHPSGRLLNERPSSEADWVEVFKFCAKNNKVLEINSFYNRLDLRDDLVRQAKEYGVKFVIDTDAHEISQMDNMKFGVSVARRGWVTKREVINSWEWKKFCEWFKIRR